MTDSSQPLAPPALVYRNRPGLPGLVIKNLFLNLVTLWFYRFWAKTRWRRHIWSNVSLLGDPVEYTGTGPEMFKGFLVAVAFLAPFFIVFGVWETMVAEGGLGLWIEQIVYFAVLYALIVAASFYARRYRLSRTRWRGTALMLDAKFGDYLKFYLRTQAINALTLFVMTPRASMAIEAWLVSRTRLGAVAFACVPDWRPLMKTWLILLASGLATGVTAFMWPIGLAITLPVAFCALVAYRVGVFRVTAAGTKLNGTAFVSRAKAAEIGIQLFLAALVGMIVLVVVAGLVARFSVIGGAIGTVAAIVVFALIRDAWIAPWIVDHVVNSVTISDPEALAAIAAGSEDALTRGEGLADSFDVGIG